MTAIASNVYTLMKMMSVYEEGAGLVFNKEDGKWRYMGITSEWVSF